MSPIKSTDSYPPRKEEVERLKKELKEREDAAVEKRFLEIEKRVEEVAEMAREPHECLHAADFASIEKTFAAIEKSFQKGEKNFAEIEHRFDRASAIKFWGIIGSVIALVLAVVAAASAFSSSATTQQVHTDKLEKMDTKLGNVEKDVIGLKVSFSGVEKESKKMQMKIDSNMITPEKLEAAVRKGLGKPER